MSKFSPALALAALLASGAATAKKPEPPHDYGPAPDWRSFRERGERAIISRLIDPDSAKIQWLGGYHQGGYQPFLERKVYGYVACGLVNARNRMGGYTGDRAFVVVIDNDLLLRADIDERAGSFVERHCMAALQNGLLPLTPTEAAAPPPSSPTGLSLKAMPEGAYVSAVAPGSAAEKAGLRPGMVIETINAISLKGMGEAMLKIIDAAGSKASLGVIGGKTITIGG